jgi:hypothetical protein
MKFGTYTVTPFTGAEKDYAADPRGRSLSWRTDPLAWCEKVKNEVRLARPERLLIQRQAGMLKEHKGTSWEMEDYAVLTDGERGALEGLGAWCRQQGIVLAFYVGLNVRYGGVLQWADMRISPHEAAMRRTCSHLRAVGASELWIDTGGEIKYTGEFGDGVELAEMACGSEGITLVPEWTSNLLEGVRCPVFTRHQKTKDEPKQRPLPESRPESRPDRPVYVGFGYNGGGIEDAETIEGVCTDACRRVAWNADARQLAQEG